MAHTAEGDAAHSAAIRSPRKSASLTSVPTTSGSASAQVASACSCVSPLNAGNGAPSPQPRTSPSSTTSTRMLAATCWAPREMPNGFMSGTSSRRADTRAIRDGRLTCTYDITFGITTRGRVSAGTSRLTSRPMPRRRASPTKRFRGDSAALRLLASAWYGAIMALDPSLLPATAAELAARDPQEIIAFALREYSPDLGLSFSGAEDVVLIDMAARVGLPFGVFSLDTGRLHPETYQFIERVRTHYGLPIETFAPQAEAVQTLVREKGLFSFYVDGHKECCGIRKVEP